MTLTKEEQDIVQIFKDAGFSGRIFRRSGDALKWALSDQRAVVCRHYYGERRRVHPEACRWHIEERDARCKGCDRFKS